MSKWDFFSQFKFWTLLLRLLRAMKILKRQAPDPRNLDLKKNDLEELH